MTLLNKSIKVAIPVVALEPKGVFPHVHTLSFRVASRGAANMV